MRQVLIFVVILSVVNFGILMYQMWPENESTQIVAEAEAPPGSLLDTLRRSRTPEARLTRLESSVRSLSSEISRLNDSVLNRNR